MKIHLMIKQTRELLGETQTEFGKRFLVNPAAVSLWESGKRHAPYVVIEYCMYKYILTQDCPLCKGTGKVETMKPLSMPTLPITQ